MVAGVRVINGKIIVNYYENALLVPKDSKVVQMDEVADYVENLYHGRG